MLLPRDPPLVIPGDLKSLRLAEKIAETRAKGDSSLLAKMWAYMGGLTCRPTTSLTSACRGTGTGRTTFSGIAAALCKEIVSRGNLSVVLHSDDRLTFFRLPVSHARAQGGGG